jgi:hypothetical protein
MAQCKFCGSETQLFDGGVPICLNCMAVQENPKKKPPASESEKDKNERAG